MINNKSIWYYTDKPLRANFKTDFCYNCNLFVLLNNLTLPSLFEPQEMNTFREESIYEQKLLINRFVANQTIHVEQHFDELKFLTCDEFPLEKEHFIYVCNKENEVTSILAEFDTSCCLKLGSTFCGDFCEQTIINSINKEWGGVVNALQLILKSIASTLQKELEFITMDIKLCNNC